MLTVYVKHYLTPEGIHYFKGMWFPKVHAVLREQNGFISLIFDQDGDCMDIVLKFKDQETLDRWIAVPIHDELITALDPFRSRDYWKAASTEDENADPALLEWEKIKPAST